ncbi:MAG: hypothetical protein HC788_06950 [Sphingopyxis sp.]|nr:hypothetical protein [Sphingopyxis sp.]
MKLLLTLLVLLTGFSGVDAARAAPVTPAAFGTALALAEVASDVQAARHIHRPQQCAQVRFIGDVAGSDFRAIDTALVQPGLTPRGMRARE